MGRKLNDSGVREGGNEGKGEREWARQGGTSIHVLEKSAHAERMKVMYSSACPGSANTSDSVCSTGTRQHAGQSKRESSKVRHR